MLFIISLFCISRCCVFSYLKTSKNTLNLNIIYLTIAFTYAQYLIQTLAIKRATERVKKVFRKAFFFFFPYETWCTHKELFLGEKASNRHLAKLLTAYFLQLCYVRTQMLAQTKLHTPFPNIMFHKLYVEYVWKKDKIQLQSCSNAIVFTKL